MLYSVLSDIFEVNKVNYLQIEGISNMTHTYAQVTKGRRTRGFITESIQSIAENELGHRFSPEDLAYLAQRFSLDCLLNSCEKVKIS